ncbi:MAG: ATP/GTP-binding protein [Candidatus Hydrothermarchaeota archaeon]
MRSKQDIKIIVIGTYRSGKSTLVESLTKKVLHVERLGTTIGFDYGDRKIDSLELRLFGTPSRREFEFMHEILSMGIHGIILVVDSTDPDSFQEALEILDKIELKRKVPFVVAANKQDMHGALKPWLVRDQMNLSEEIPVIGTVATEAEGVEELLAALLKLIE